MRPQVLLETVRMTGLSFAAAVLIAAMVPRNAIAAWPADPTVNVPICTASNAQDDVSITPDGLGGAIIAWADLRNGSDEDIYVRRIDVDGNALWIADGVLACGALGAQTVPVLTPDGTGGVIVVWEDLRGGADADIYAQRVDGSGTVQWAADGVPICTRSTSQIGPGIVSDAIGGAFIAWDDQRNDSGDIYFQHVNAAGDTLLQADGLPMCVQPGVQGFVQLAPDGSGGTIVTWQDNRVSNDTDIYARRFDAFGNMQWAVGGHSVCSVAGFQQVPRIVSDFAGGAIITWQDFRAGQADIYAQRISGNGFVQWATGGVPVCTDSMSQSNPTLAVDNAGGAVIAWTDMRGGTVTDVYAQRIDDTGAPLWALDGIAVGVGPANQGNVKTVQDGGDGAFLVWQDLRNGQDIYGQHLDGAGVAEWTAGGEPICSNGAWQWYPAVCYNGGNAAIVAWPDNRNSTLLDFDIYADRITHVGGTTGAPVPAAPTHPSLATWPNPFRASTRIGFDLALPGAVQLDVFDVRGRRVRGWADEGMGAGSHAITWDGRDDTGRRLAAGVYLARLQVGNEVQTARVTFVR